MRTPNREAPARSTAIDLLRGLAVSAVMLAHLPFSQASLTGGVGNTLYPSAAISNLLVHGHYGVQLFLVISGYCIHARWSRRADLELRVDFLAFWRRRLARLYPPYFVVLAACIVLTLLARKFFAGSLPAVSSGQLAIDIFLLLFLLQNLTDASMRVGNPPFWSLALEEQLYLLYFPWLEVRRRLGWRAALAIPLIVNIAWLLLGRLVPPSWHMGWHRIAPAYWFAWVLGALSAEVHFNVTTVPSWTRSWWLFGLVLTTGACLPPPSQAFVITLSFFFLLNAMIQIECRGAFENARWLEPLVRLGKISYSVYLIHNIAFVVGKRFLISFGMPPFLVLLLRGAVGLIAGYVVFRLVEVPFLRASQRIRIPFVRPTPREPQTISVREHVSIPVDAPFGARGVPSRRSGSESSIEPRE